MKKINSFLLPFLIILLLISTKVISQENSNLIITPEITKKICEEHNYNNIRLIYPVSQVEVNFDVYEPGQLILHTTQKKLIYLVSETPADLEKFSGFFSKMPGEYILVPSDFKEKYRKNELTSDFVDFYNDGSNARFYPLIKKKDTGEFFYVMAKSFLFDVEAEQSFINLLNNIHKLGYKEYKDEYGDYFIKSKTCEIKLDTWTISELKLNPSYITTLDNDQIKIAALVKQTIPHSKILDKYLGLHRIQRNKMSSIDIKNWRTATANAQKLNNQIYKLSEKYFGNYAFTLLNKSDTQEVFSENLLASKGVLGM